MDAATAGRSDSVQPVTLLYRLNEDDLLALNARVRVLLNLPGWLFNLIMRLIASLGSAIAVWSIDRSANTLVAAGLLGVVIFAAFPRLMRYSVRKRANATYKPSQLDVRLVAEDRSILLEGGENSSTIAWSSIERGEETRAHFFLFLTRLQAVIVPKRAFADASGMDRFRQMIAERVKDFVLVG